MGFKGIFKEKSSSTKLGVLVMLMIVSAIIHMLLANGLIMLFSNVDLVAVQWMKLKNQSIIDAVKFTQLLSSIGIFIVPVLVYAHICNFDLKLNLNLNRQVILLAITIMLLINPFIAFIYEWNMSFNFPEWALSYDKKAEYLTKYFLKMNSVGDLANNLLILAVVPAIGEELLFRGYLQQTFKKWLGKPHLAIVITAILFSAIHMQFQGFLPRFVLGLLLGYFFYWSGSLWLPIIAHFLNNALAVLLAYSAFSDYAYLAENTATWQQAFFSFMAVCLLLFLLTKNLSIKKG